MYNFNPTIAFKGNHKAKRCFDGAFECSHFMDGFFMLHNKTAEPK